MSETSQTRWHRANAGGESGPMIGKFTGFQVVALGLSMGGGFLLFLTLTGSQVGFLPSLAVAALVPAAMTVILLTLVRGKPRGFFTQWLEWWRVKQQGQALLDKDPSKSKTASVRDGFISHGLLVWEGKAGKGSASCGLEICCPAMEALSVDSLNQIEDTLRGAIRQMPREWTLQVCWRKGGGYREEILPYHEDTETLAQSPWSRRQRNERFVRAIQEDEEGLVSSARVRLFIKAPLNLRQLLRGSPSAYDRALQTISRNFEGMVAEFTRVMTQLDGHASLLSDEELFQEVGFYLNPSASKSLEWDPERSLFDNFIHGEVVPVTEPEAGFFLAGRYHSSLALSQLPESTASGIITHLTSLPEKDFRITVHLENLDPLSEIEKAESRKAKLERARQSSHHSRLDYDIRILNDRIQRLSSGNVSPVRVQLLVHLSADSPGELNTRLKALVGAASGMKSAKFYEVALPTTCRNVFLAGLPGSPYREPAFWHLVDDPTAINLIPISGDSNSSLRGAEALYRSRQGNLIGVSGFHGQGERKTPSHAFITGRTGSGKSVHGIDFITQLDPFADWRVVIDNGRSFETCMKVLSGGRCRTFSPDVNGSDTLNYHDTLGVPLTSLHLSRVVAILHLMVGHKSDLDQDAYRKAILNRCLGQFYRDWVERWFEEDPNREEMVMNLLACLRLFQEEEDQATDLAELLSLYRAKEGDKKDFASNQLESAIQAIRQEGVSPDVAALSVAHFDRTQAPTHRDFHEWMLAHAESTTRDNHEIATLATLLEPWRADSGMMGCLFIRVNF